MMPPNPRGSLLVVEGLDKAGKSTQCTKLVESLGQNGHKLMHVRFPDRTTTIGKMIDAYLKGTSEIDDHAIHLLFSANRWEVASKIKEAIASGTTVVVDRYYWSGVAFTVAKENPSITFEWALGCDVGLPSPDLLFFLDISPDAAKKRGGGYGEERYEKEALQRKVRELFSKLRAKETGKFDIALIDASKSLDEVFAEMLHLAQRKVAQNSVGETATELGLIVA